MENKFHDKILKLAKTPTSTNADIDVVFRDMKKQRLLWKDISSNTYIDRVLEEYDVENASQKDIDNMPLEFNKSLPFSFPLKIYRSNPFICNVISLCIGNSLAFMLWRIITIFAGELSESMPSAGVFNYNPVTLKWERTYNKTAYLTSILNSFIYYGSRAEHLKTLNHVSAASDLIDVLYKKGARCDNLNSLINPIVIPIKVFRTQSFSANVIIYRKVIENNDAYAKDMLIQQLIEKLNRRNKIV